MPILRYIQNLEMMYFFQVLNVFGPSSRLRYYGSYPREVEG